MAVTPTTYAFTGNGKGLDTEFKKLSWPGTASEVQVATGFRKVLDYAICPFPGTNVALDPSGTTAGVTLYATLKGTVAGTTTGDSWGYQAGGTVTFQRNGTADEAVTYAYRLCGHH